MRSGFFVKPARNDDYGRFDADSSPFSAHTAQSIDSKQGVVDMQERSSFLSGQDDYYWADFRTGVEFLPFQCLSREKPLSIENIILQKS